MVVAGFSELLNRRLERPGSLSFVGSLASSPRWIPTLVIFRFPFSSKIVSQGYCGLYLQSMGRVMNRGRSIFLMRLSLLMAGGIIGGASVGTSTSFGFLTRRRGLPDSLRL